MIMYEELLTEADGQNLIVREKDIPGYGGRIYGNRIAIRKDIETETEKACVLAEELGHHYTTTGDIMDQTDAASRKQELQARVWAYNRLIGLQGLISAHRHGCRSRYEAAEYLDVTEDFLEEAYQYYRNKYGIMYQVDNFVIYFEPCFGVFESISPA